MTDIFVSRPTATNPAQSEFCDSLIEMLTERGLTPRTLGQTDYPNVAPIHAVREMMSNCNGAVILGLQQMHVKKGTSRTGSTTEEAVCKQSYPTPWNQIEAGMAFAFQIPVLLIREGDIKSGVFGLGATDKYIHTARLGEDWLSSEQFRQPFNTWHKEVLMNSQRNL